MVRGNSQSNTTGGGDRELPRIPDHEVLRQIGKGSFGEVWLARAVTGVYRAVKVIWRDDFDNHRDFEREFEAIKRYEPISRQHPGLVDVLQVGRDESRGYYYYIMEVADALEEGRDINPETYTPHTFRSEMLEKERIPLTSCVELGAQLADALQFLHERDLIHRDVKLSNVIVVGGQAKLADIGLVAALGDRSFVGTEGYVPPEGAGTASADIFSLGMVLYELSTGKDRLDFPDIPTDFREHSHPDLWRRINQVVCKACARKVDDRYDSAEEMAAALRGENIKQRPAWHMIVGVTASAVACGIGLIALFAAPQPRVFEITTDPPGATVYAGAEELGVTPLKLDQRPEEGISFEIRMPGFRNELIEYGGASDTRDGLHLVLEDSKFPQPGSVWVNSLNLEFKPGNQAHRLDYPVHAELFMEFALEQNRVFEGEVVMQEHNGEEIPIPIVSQREAREFAEWLQMKDQAGGFIGPNYTYRAQPFTNSTVRWPNKRLQQGRNSTTIQPFVVVVEKQRYGRLIVTSDPMGAEVYDRSGDKLGETPLEIGRVRTGPVSFEVREDGYKPYYLDGIVEADGLHELRAVLEEGDAIEFGKPWYNSLGIDFRPVGDKILVAATETRVRDYRMFCQETGADFPSGDATSEMHPVDGISRHDAEAFCQWLTEYEREIGMLSERYEYRLPTDEEWSSAAGLPGERGPTPAIRNGVLEGVYPWGYEWPPPDGAGNFADESLREWVDAMVGETTLNAPGPTIIEGYHDMAPKLAWVNEYNTNRYGLYNISGNVWEWVSDSYLGGGGVDQAGTIRGGSWQTSDRRELLTCYRQSRSPSTRDNGVGFRCVLARAGQ